MKPNVRSIHVVMLAIVAAGCAAAVIASDSGVPSAVGKRLEQSDPVNEKNFARIKAGKGKMTEADVFALLGPTSLVLKPPDEEYDKLWDIQMRWTRTTEIEIEFKGGKAQKLTGRFSPGMPSKKINLENFKKLNRGMTADAAEAILGKRNGTYNSRGVMTLEWERPKGITLTFQDGKVKDLLWIKSLEE